MFQTFQHYFKQINLRMTGPPTPGRPEVMAQDGLLQQLESELQEQNILHLLKDDSDLPRSGATRACLWSLLKKAYGVVCQMTNATNDEKLNKQLETLQNNVLSAMTAEIAKLKDFCPQAAQNISPNRVSTYSEAVQRSNKPPANYADELKKPVTKAHLSLSGDSSQLSTLPTTLSTVPTTFLKNRDDGSVLIGFESEEAMTKAKDNIVVSSPGVIVEEKVRTKKLTIKNADISSFPVESTDKMSKELIQRNDANIIEMLYEKNLDVKKMIEEGERIEIVHFKRHFRDNNLATIAIRVTYRLFNHMLSKGFVFMGNSFSRVEERFHIRQCFTCQKFGHISSQCTAKTPTCYHCAGPHYGRNCDSKDGNHQRCANCSQSIDPHLQSRASTHNAASKDCPSFLKRIQNPKNF